MSLAGNQRTIPMRFNTKMLGVVGLVATLVIVVIWVTRPRKHEPEPSAQPEVAAHQQTAASQLQQSPSSPEQIRVAATTTEEPPKVAVTETNEAPNWEEKIDEVLRANIEPEEKGKKLLAVFPDLPEEGQIEAAQHIANLTSDEDYSQLAPYLVNPDTPQDVIDILMSDLLNRPDSIKLPTLLQIAQKPQHPDAGQAKDILELYLEEDYGNDWGKWEQKLGEWLKDNPD